MTPATMPPIITAHTKLSWPCEAMRGMLTPQLRLRAQPAAKPPAVTKVAWARLTIPPMPVTTMKDSRMIEMASPWAMAVWAVSVAWNHEGNQCRA